MDLGFVLFSCHSAGSSRLEEMFFLSEVEIRKEKVWRGLKTISGYKDPDSQVHQWANDLNIFFNRFDQSGAPPRCAIYTWLLYLSELLQDVYFGNYDLSFLNEYFV